METDGGLTICSPKSSWLYKVTGNYRLRIFSLLISTAVTSLQDNSITIFALANYGINEMGCVADSYG